MITSDPNSPNSPKLEARLRSILECLIKFKLALVNKYTLTSQKPSILHNLSPFLRLQANILNDCFTTMTFPEMTDDTDLNDCIECLKKCLHPWNSDLSILGPQMCEKILIASDLNLSPELIEEVLKIYLPEQEIDGVSSSEDEYDKEK